jgi:hypothetical protein
MLTDATLKSLKPKDKLYKVVDRDGMYALVQPSGKIAFRYDYRLNGRRETVTLGRYAPTDLSLARAREKLVDAKRAIAEGRSPAHEKQREKRRLKEAKSFGEFGERWMQEAKMADSTRAMRRSIFERELLPVWRRLDLPHRRGLANYNSKQYCTPWGGGRKSALLEYRTGKGASYVKRSTSRRKAHMRGSLRDQERPSYAVGRRHGRSR